MKVQVVQSELVKALSTVLPAVAVRTPNPVLTGFYIQAKEGEVSITATNLDISICKTIVTNVEDMGSVVANAKLMYEIVRRLPKDALITLEKSGHGLKIYTDTSEFSINGFFVADFPDTKFEEGKKEPFAVDGKLFSNMIKGTEVFASKDASKGIICGVKTEVTPTEVHMVALDGYKLAKRKEIIDSGQTSEFIIAAESMKEIMKIASDCDNLIVEIADKGIKFTIDDTIVTVRLMDGDYLDYRKIVPEEYAIHTKVNRKELLNALDRASLIVDGQNNLVKINISGFTLQISANSEMGHIDERVVVETDGEIFIGFNASFFMEILRVIDDDEIMLNMNGSGAACVVTSVDGSNNYTYLILPVRLK